MGDETVSEEHAHAIGKSVRARGTASIEDIQCVADEMKRMSPKALKALNDAGVVTGICRGPVTDMVPELADVNPRGWGDRTWDEVRSPQPRGLTSASSGTMSVTGPRQMPVTTPASFRALSALGDMRFISSATHWMSSMEAVPRARTLLPM